jgi:ABC-type nitrate/sulfonate/bicarbonate transport system ATPase subunit
MAPGIGMLNLRGIGRHFGDPPRWVLSGIDLSIEAGEFVCLLGPSGSGKTTLLRIIGGLDRPDRGELHGSTTHGSTTHVQATHGSTTHPPRIAMAFQDPRLVPWMTIRDNLLLVMEPGAKARVSEFLHRMELDDCMDSYPGQLSGGMQRRVALARALLVEPELLLLDEPLVSLDATLEERMTHVLRSHWLAHRPTVIMVTHDPRQSARLASRVIGLTAGQTGLALDEKLAGPVPGSRTELEEASIIRHLVKACPTLPMAS